LTLAIFTSLSLAIACQGDATNADPQSSEAEATTDEGSVASPEVTPGTASNEPPQSSVMTDEPTSGTSTEVTETSGETATGGETPDPDGDDPAGQTTGNASTTAGEPSDGEDASTLTNPNGGNGGSGGSTVAMGGDSDGAGGADTGVGGAGGSGGASGEAAEEATSAGGAGGTPEPSSGVPSIHFVGRFTVGGDPGMRFEWSGSGVVAAFDGTSVSVSLSDSGSNQFTVVIDGDVQPTLVAQAGTNIYELATGLTSGTHAVEIYRRTEASFGVSSFIDFDFGPDGVLLAPPTPPARKIEIIGDSISCGYGNEGESASCGFSADTENHYMTYGAIAARALDAEVVTIAWSGKGIVYNYGDDTIDPLPVLYDRILPNTGGEDWDFSVQPDAVVINLGTNDFSTDNDPSPELFASEYEAFLEHLRGVYPDAFILCTVGNLLSGDDLNAARAGIVSAVQARSEAGDANVADWEMNVPNDNPGCDYHPSVPTHQLMADALVRELQSRLGW
jgi:lysophospholipase L1-like esterase